MENILQRRLEILWGIAHRAAEKGLSSSDLMGNMVLAQEVFPECSAFLVLDKKGKVQACLSSHFDCSTWQQTRPLEDNKLTGVVQNTGMPMLADDFQPGLPGLKSAPAMVVPILQKGASRGHRGHLGPRLPTRRPLSSYKPEHRGPPGQRSGQAHSWLHDIFQ